MVAAYFKNVGQTRTLIELIHDRSEIQEAARVEMKGRFDHYNLELEEVLIGVGEPTVSIGEPSPAAVAVRQKLQAALTRSRDVTS